MKFLLEMIPDHFHGYCCSSWGVRLQLELHVQAIANGVNLVHRVQGFLTYDIVLAVRDVKVA